MSSQSGAAGTTQWRCHSPPAPRGPEPALEAALAGIGTALSQCVELKPEPAGWLGPSTAHTHTIYQVTEHVGFAVTETVFELLIACERNTDCSMHPRACLRASSWGFTWSFNSAEER